MSAEHKQALQDLDSKNETYSACDSRIEGSSKKTEALPVADQNGDEQNNSIADEIREQSDLPEQEADVYGHIDKKQSLPDEAPIVQDVDEKCNDFEPASSTVNGLAKADSQPLHSVFSNRWKNFIIFMSAVGAFISPISANLYFPALNTLAAYYSVTPSDINLTLTSYMIFQGIAPTLFGDIADQQGHRVACVVCLIIYFCANIGLAVQNSFAALIVLRCLQSTGASGTVALRNAVVAEVITPAERGVYLGLMQAGNAVAPALGPVLGGVLTEYLGWRSTFWFLVILCGVYLVPYALFVPETNRKIVGNGSIPPANWWNKNALDFARERRQRHNDLENMSANSPVQGAKQTLKWPNPLRAIVIMGDKDIALILLYAALLYAAIYDVITSIPVIYARVYGFNDIQIGLCYIPIGVGCAVGVIVNGKMLNKTYRKVAKENGFSEDVKRGHDLRHFPIEKARLSAVLPCVSIFIVITIAYGWVLDAHCNLAAPLIFSFLDGVFLIAAFQCLTNLLVDICPGNAATVTAAANLARCLFGAGATALINPMLDAIGIGWTFTLIGLICAGLSPILLLIMKKGPKWREARHVRLDRKKEAKRSPDEKPAQT